MERVTTKSYLCFHSGTAALLSDCCLPPAALLLPSPSLPLPHPIITHFLMKEAFIPSMFLVLEPSYTLDVRWYSPVIPLVDFSSLLSAPAKSSNPHPKVTGCSMEEGYKHRSTLPMTHVQRVTRERSPFYNSELAPEVIHFFPF
jgi:hypothetical protein